MRFNCEFRKCMCSEFIKNHGNKLCQDCNHAKLWHSNITPRKPAHKPVYVNYHRERAYPRIFTPIQVAVFVPEAVVVYCDTIENLPI